MIINKTTYAVVREYDIVRKMILNKILTGTWHGNWRSTELWRVTNNGIERDMKCEEK